MPPNYLLVGPQADWLCWGRKMYALSLSLTRLRTGIRRSGIVVDPHYIARGGLQRSRGKRIKVA